MANAFFNFVTRFTPGTLVRAEEVNAVMDAIEAGFEGVEQVNGVRIELPDNFTGNAKIPTQTLANKLVYLDVEGNVNLLDKNLLDNSTSTATDAAAAAATSAGAASASAGAAATSASAAAASAAASATSAGAAATSASQAATYASAADAARLAIIAAGGLLTVSPTVRTATFTAAVGVMYPLDMRVGGFTMNLPPSPSVGDRVGFFDMYGAALLHDVLLDGNSGNIEGTTTPWTVNIRGIRAELYYFGGTRGWVFL